MAELDPNDVHASLRSLVAEGVESQADALRVAATLRLRDVLKALDWDFLHEHGEVGSQFMQAWLAQLGPFEQMEAAAEAAEQHLLSLVHIEHSYGVGARILLTGLERVTEATADTLSGLRAFTDGPDAETSAELAEQLEALAPALREVHRSIARIRAAAQEDQAEPERTRAFVSTT
jgi:hypothetical protein